MRILVSNDDGVAAPGLAALAGAVRDLGTVTVVAPADAQSGAGHGITVREPLTVDRAPLAWNGEAFEAYSVDGRPVDCVRLASRSLMAEPPDLVLSGINHGSNDGICVFYSGTVAAAAEAALLGLPAVAFSASVGPGECLDYAALAAICRRVLDVLLPGLRGGDLVSVNLPRLEGGAAPAGVHVVRQATVELIDSYELVAEAGAERVYRLSQDFHWERHEQETDTTSLRDGYISVTPLQIDLTDYRRLNDLAQEDWSGVTEGSGGGDGI